VSRPGPAAAHEAGMTLVELLVTMAIGSIVAAIVLGFLVNTTSVVAHTESDVQAENDARLAMRTLTEDLRAAQPSSISFSSATAGACPSSPTTATCVSFTIVRATSANPNCRSTVTYGLLAGKVQQTRQDANCPTNLSIARPLISSVANTASTPLLTYYDALGNQLTSGQAAARIVKVTLLVTYTGGRQPLTLTSTVALRNAR